LFISIKDEQFVQIQQKAVIHLLSVESTGTIAIDCIVMNKIAFICPMY